MRPFWYGVLALFIVVNAAMLVEGAGTWRNVVGLVCCSAALVGHIVLAAARRKRS